jgi:hypothetical protein
VPGVPREEGKGYEAVEQDNGLGKPIDLHLPRR